MEDEHDCGYDFIEVFSGFDDAGPSYGRFCGNKVFFWIQNDMNLSFFLYSNRACKTQSWSFQVIFHHHRPFKRNFCFSSKKNWL
jgi:hypothetical protein